MSRHLLRPALNERIHRNRRRKYSLRDEFLIDRAAGSVNGTAAEPGPGVRTVVDTNSKLSIASSLLSFATGGVTNGNPALWYPSISRVAGLILLGKLNYTTSGGWILGWDTDQTGGLASHAFFLTGTALSANSGLAGPTVATIAASTDYQLALVLRAVGAHFFVKGGAWTNWTLIYSFSTASNTPVFPGIGGNATSVMTFDFIRVPSTFWLPTPLASDGFATAFGTTDGLGHAETSGAGSGGGAVTWTQQVGTWTVASAKANAATLVGGIAIATVPTTTADVMVDVKITRSAGAGGGVLRYTDANNYLYWNHDGTNCFLKQVLAGVTTTLVTAAATYSANAVARLDAIGAAGRLYYNNALVGTTASINAALTATAHGLYVTDTTVTLDDFVVRAKGVGNEYAVLDGF